jgi:hypothetical protein
MTTGDFPFRFEYHAQPSSEPRVVTPPQAMNFCGWLQGYLSGCRQGRPANQGLTAEELMVVEAQLALLMNPWMVLAPAVSAPSTETDPELQANS